MTAENAAFYRRMLSVGLSDTYFRDVERALEEEEPLSDLLLELALCPSDTSKAISVLDHYLENREPNEAVVHEMLFSELRNLHMNSSISLRQAAEAALAILESERLYHEEPWREVELLSYEYDEVKEGFLCMDDFLSDFFDVLYPKEKGE